MAVPTPTDIDVVQRQTFTMRVVWRTSAATPVPISLANYRAHMQVRTKPGGAGVPIIDLSSLGTSPGLIREPSGDIGAIIVRIPATLTALITKNCFYDLFIINATDPTDATRLIYGAITISKSVTVEP